MSDILFVIILHNYTSTSSPTVLSISDIAEECDFIYLINNKENNLKLSIRYNEAIKFATTNRFKRVVFFDDDTIVSRSYINELKNNVGHIAYAPKIISNNNNTVGPIIYKNWMRSCMSGVCLSVEFCSKFLFDERYSLYGIDDYLFIFFASKKTPVFTMNSVLIHDISTNKENISNLSVFRLRELLRGNILNFINSPIIYKYFFFRKILNYSYRLLLQKKIGIVLQMILSPVDESIYIHNS